MATLPNSCAGKFAKAPLKAPTAVRAALTMTMSSFIRNSCCGSRAGRLFGTAASLEGGWRPVNKCAPQRYCYAIGDFCHPAQEREPPHVGYRAATKVWLPAQDWDYAQGLGRVKAGERG